MIMIMIMMIMMIMAELRVTVIFDCRNFHWALF
jgi:hypothetical protein